MERAPSRARGLPLALPLALPLGLLGCEALINTTPSLDVQAGAQAAGAQAAGAQQAGGAAGAQAGQSAGAQSAGAQSAGAQSAGAQSAGAQSAGAQSAGEQSAGAQAGQAAGAQSAGAQPGGAQVGGAQAGAAAGGVAPTCPDPREERCGTHLDEDCDGAVDEGCPAVCLPPLVAPPTTLGALESIYQRANAAAGNDALWVSWYQGPPTAHETVTKECDVVNGRCRAISAPAANFETPHDLSWNQGPLSVGFTSITSLVLDALRSGGVAWSKTINASAPIWEAQVVGRYGKPLVLYRTDAGLTLASFSQGGGPPPALLEVPYAVNHLGHRAAFRDADERVYVVHQDTEGVDYTRRVLTLIALDASTRPATAVFERPLLHPATGEPLLGSDPDLLSDGDDLWLVYEDRQPPRALLYAARLDGEGAVVAGPHAVYQRDALYFGGLRLGAGLTPSGAKTRAVVWHEDNIGERVTPERVVMLALDDEARAAGDAVEVSAGYGRLFPTLSYLGARPVVVWSEAELDAQTGDERYALRLGELAPAEELRCVGE